MNNITVNTKNTNNKVVINLLDLLNNGLTVEYRSENGNDYINICKDVIGEDFDPSIKELYYSLPIVSDITSIIYTRDGIVVCKLEAPKMLYTSLSISSSPEGQSYNISLFSM